MRMKKSVLPKDLFFDEIRGNPDIYGPFWISTTLVFLIFASGSILQAINAYIDKKKYQYNVTKLGTAASIIYAYSFGLPLIWWALFRWWKIPFPYLNLVDLYGYSMTIMLPVAVSSHHSIHSDYLCFWNRFC
jgi:hypothetical protein